LDKEKESRGICQRRQNVLQSSNSRKSKILTVAMEINEDIEVIENFQVGRNPVGNIVMGSTC
jgi:hypothetical protein